MSAERPLTDDLGFLLSRASGAVARSVSAALGPLGLRVRSYSVLALAVEHDTGVTQRSLAAVVGLDPSQVVALVDELQDRGLVERAADPNDRRNRLVRPTAEGRRVFAEAHRLVTEQDDRHFAQVPPERLEAFRDVLRRVAFPGA